MIEIKEKKDCCGCSACSASCSKHAITMNEDVEGFLYPDISTSLCVGCGICEKVCPIKNYKLPTTITQEGYIVQNKDDTILAESTAGGVFTAVGKLAIGQGGVVFGGTLSENFVVYHTYVESEDKLALFRNSKYVQSMIGDCYKQVEEFLLQGRTVCFSGTPCQCEGLRAYLKEDYAKLIVVDVVCRAVPSPLVFRKYLEVQRKRFSGELINIRFRDKYYGYKYSTLNIKTSDSKDIYHEGVETDPWLRAFFSDICDRPSCHDCKFRTQYHMSDITIFDCFNVGRFSEELDNDKGATRVLINTTKGKEVFENIKGEFRCIQVPVNELVDGVKEMFEGPSPNPNRDKFLSDAIVLNGEELFHKWFPENLSVKIKRFIRHSFLRFGIYDKAKKTYVRLTHKY